MKSEGRKILPVFIFYDNLGDIMRPKRCVRVF